MSGSAERVRRVRTFRGVRAVLVAVVASCVGIATYAHLDARAVDAAERGRVASRTDAVRQAVRAESARLVEIARTPSCDASDADFVVRWASDGTVTCATHWPESTGTRAVAAPEVDAVGDFGGAAWFVATSSGPRLAWVARTGSIDDASSGDGSTGDASSGDASTGDGSTGDGSTGDGSIDDPSAGAGSSGDVASVAVAGVWGERLRERLEARGIDPDAAAFVELPGIGDARLAIAVEGPRAVARRGGRFAVAAGVAAALALLGGLALAAVRDDPAKRLVAAVDAISAGHADYDFDLGPRGALDDVAASFSRLRRALDAERARVAAAERVAAWSEAARRVAHEIKNPLAPIRITMQNLVRARERAPEAFDALFEDGSRAVLEEVERIDRTVTAFSEYARLPKPRRGRFDLAGVVDDVVALHAGGDATVEIASRSREPLVVDADRDLVLQALRNLVVNAVAAVASAGEGGRVTVAAEVSGADAVVTVTDDGPGFDEDVLPRVFDPYFTTREGGTGLGLAIAQRVVVEHGGAIEAHNADPGGAAVVLRLPLAPAGAEPRG